MFVLLEHTTPPSSTAPDAVRGVHWDFMVETAESGRLPTWRLATDPRQSNLDIPAERIQDHRRAYLEYEGEVSGGRGSVRRLDRGPATVEALEGVTLAVLLEGEHLRGRYEVTHKAGGSVVFRRVGD
jgi:hypothetical protein